MSATIANLSVMLGVNTAGLTRGFSSASRQANQFASGLGGGMDSGLGGLAAAFSGVTATVASFGVAAVAALGAAGAGLVGWGVMVAGQFEQTAMAFEVMIGSADKSKKFVDDLFALAARTPFEFKDLTAGAQRLMSFGFEAEQILPMVERLGNLAAASPKGMAEGFDRITLAVGQMWGKQRVMSQEMNQLTEAGIPAWKALAATLGTDVKTAMQMVENRQVSAATGINALLELAESPKFGSLMQRQSTTLFGVWSTLKDNFSLVLRDLGFAAIEGFNLKGVVSGLSAATGWIRANIIPAVTAAFTFVGRIAQTGFQLFQMFVGRITEIVRPLWEDIIGVMGPLLEKGNTEFGGFIERAKVLFQGFLDFITPQWKAMVGLFRGVWDALTSTIKALFGSDIVQGGIANMKAGFSDFAAVVAPLIEKVRNTIITAAIMGEFAFRNLPDIAALAFNTIGAKAISLVTTIQDAFKGGLPGIAVFVGEVFNRIFSAISGMIDRMAQKLVENFKSVSKNMPLLISGVKDVKDVWTPLTDSFRADMDNLPAIADGGLKAMGEKMAAEQARLEGKLGPQWQDFLAKRWGENFKPEGRGAIGDFFAHAAAFAAQFSKLGETGPGGKGSPFRLPEAGKPDAAQPGIFTRLIAWATTHGKPLENFSTALPEAFVRGSAQAVSAINKAGIEGQKLDVAREIADNGKQHLGMLGRILDAIKANAPIDPEVV